MVKWIVIGIIAFLGFGAIGSLADDEAKQNKAPVAANGVDNSGAQHEVAAPKPVSDSGADLDLLVQMTEDSTPGAIKTVCTQVSSPDELTPPMYQIFENGFGSNWHGYSSEEVLDALVADAC